MGLTKAAIKSRLIEKGVREYFQEFPWATYAGLISTGRVLERVRGIVLARRGYTFTQDDAGETFDRIRELGPVGENDTAWLHAWYEGVVA